jgi:hypothetical protein
MGSKIKTTSVLTEVVIEKPGANAVSSNSQRPAFWSQDNFVLID